MHQTISINEILNIKTPATQVVFKILTIKVKKAIVENLQSTHLCKFLLDYNDKILFNFYSLFFLLVSSRQGLCFKFLFNQAELLLVDTTLFLHQNQELFPEK